MFKRRQVLKGIAGLSLIPSSFVRAGNTVVLGQSIALTGPFGAVGTQFSLGAKLYFDVLNGKGGIDGLKVDLRTHDDGDEPERCWANTERFMNEGAFALFGYGGTASTLSILAMASQGKVPLFAPLSGAQALRQPYNPYVINVRASYFEEASTIVKHFSLIGVKRVGVVYQDDLLSALEGVNRTMDALKMQPVANATIQRSSTNVESAVRLVLAKNPEAIIQICSYKSCADFIRVARNLGYTGNFYCMSFVGAHTLIADLGANARGVMVSQVVPSPYSPATAIVAEYSSAMKLKGMTSFALNHSSLEGFIAAKAFVQAVRMAGKSLDREKFLEAIQSIQAFNIGGMVLEYDARKNSLSSFVEMTMLTEHGRILR